MTLDSVHGMTSTKQIITTTILTPILMPYLYVNRAIPNKILLHSLPGCGKSLFVQAIAGQTKRALVSASPSALVSKYQGQSEKMIRALF